MASNASGYPEALCLLGKIFPKPHFRMTSHAAALTLRGAFRNGNTVGKTPEKTIEDALLRLAGELSMETISTKGRTIR